MPTFDKNWYSNRTFKNIQAASKTFEDITFTDCGFLNCQLVECTLRKCTFERCTFKGCDLSLVKLPLTRFKAVFLKDSRLIGVNWCEADWERQSLLHTKGVDFEGCLLDHSLFIGLNLTDSRFTKCKARHLDFEGADLTRADFSQADLEMSRFVGCDLTGANFVGAENYHINAAENTLHETRFSLPEAISLLHSLDIILEE